MTLVAQRATKVMDPLSFVTLWGDKGQTVEL
jgi:hypothetical protein